VTSPLGGVTSRRPAPWYGVVPLSCYFGDSSHGDGLMEGLMSRPRFFKNKIFIMHSWHIAFQDLFQSFELYSSKNIVKCPFSQVLGTKGFQKESISKKCCSIVMELSYFPPG
jgi:hypothetical protein